jgi:hypothetical protein
MSLPRGTKLDDEELIQYVLGLLPDEATDRLDKASVADDEVAAQLRSVETDLVDSYARGQLVGATLERFESYYLMSPRRCESVREAARFVRALDRAVPRDESVSGKDRLARPTRVASLVAAAALVIVGSGVLLFQAVRPRNPLPVATSESSAAGDRTQAVGQPPTGERRSVPPDGLEPDRPSAAASAATPALEPLDRRRAAPQGQIVAVVLFPPTRAVAPLPTQAIPSDAESIGFELRLESNDFPRYQVGLKDPATTNILWRSDWVPARVSGDQASVFVVVPATLLGPQHYVLDLTGRGADGRLEVMGSYTVRIAEP